MPADPPEVMAECCLLFALVWTLGGTVDVAGRKLFSSCLRSFLKGQFKPCWPKADSISFNMSAQTHPNPDILQKPIPLVSRPPSSPGWCPFRSGDFGAYSAFVSPEFLPRPASSASAESEEGSSGKSGIPILKKAFPLDGNVYDWMYNAKEGKWKQVRAEACWNTRMKALLPPLQFWWFGVPHLL